MNNNQQHISLLSLKFAKILQWLPEIIGKAVAILCFVLVLDIFVVVVLRYVFEQPSVMLQETGMWLHSVIFMLGAAYTLAMDEHVRVDIFYRSNSPRYRAWVDILGSIFLLLPVCGYLLVTSWNYVISSWSIGEASSEVGGLPALYLLKTLMLLLPLLLSMQAISTILKNFAGLVEKQTASPRSKPQAEL